MNFIDFLKDNKEKIRKATESNTKRNEKGIPVIKKDDPWRDEKESNSLLKSMRDDGQKQ